MRRLLIVGCGDVVRRVLPALARRWRIMALVRSRDPALAALGVRQIVGDLDDRATLARLAGIAHAVLHSAPPAAAGMDDARTARLLAVLAQGRALRRVVYVSTSGVYGDCAGERVPETRPLHAESARAQRRVAAEGLLRDFGRRRRCTVSLLRAPGIYAADRLPLDRLRRGLPLLLPIEDSFTNHIHATDLGRACIAALARGRPGRAYNICDDSALAMGEWFDLLAARFKLPRAPRVSRREAQQSLPEMQWSFMRESRRLENTRMKRELKLRLLFSRVADGIDPS